ncbi:hypothetical protein AAHA92_18316 [Salvia divinorum]|uniref:Uncharacterized protein n=1 Tax=Salvia divinorum TaxID=28513 RepID=A0ABD1H2Z3_SALDI
MASRKSSISNDSDVSHMYKELVKPYVPYAWTTPTMSFFSFAVPMLRAAARTYVILAIGIQIVWIVLKN